MYRSRTLLLLSAVAGTLFLAGCDKEAASGTQAPAKLGSNPAETPSATTGNTSDALAAAPKPGAVLRHLPEDCGQMKLYVNLERFGKYHKTGSDIAGVAGRVLSKTQADEKYVAPVIETLHKNGIDLTRDLREVAACAQTTTDWAALLAVDLTHLKIKPGNLLTQAAQAAGQKDARLHEKSGVRYVIPQASGGAVGFVGPGVLGFATNPSLLAEAAVTHTGGMSISDSQDQLATMRFLVADAKGTFKLNGTKEDLTASLYLPLDAKQRAELKRDATRYLLGLRDMAKQRLGGSAMAKIDVPELKQFFEDFDQLDLSVTKDELHAKLTVSTKQLQDAVSAIAAIKPTDIERVLQAAKG